MAKKKKAKKEEPTWTVTTWYNTDSEVKKAKAKEKKHWDEIAQSVKRREKQLDKIISLLSKLVKK